MSHRMHGFYAAKTWETSKPTGGLGVLSPHITMVVDSDYVIGDDHDHLWQAIFNPEKASYQEANIQYASDHSSYITGTSASDPTYWPRPAGGHYIADVILSLACGVSQPFEEDGFEFPRQDRRTLMQHYWPYAILTATGVLKYTPSASSVSPGIPGVSIQSIAHFEVDRRFGYYLDTSGASPVARANADDFVIKSVLPTIWHPGVEGEDIYDINFTDLNHFVKDDEFVVDASVPANHTAAIDEFEDVYDILQPIVSGFTGNFVVRAAAHPLQNKRKPTFPTVGVPVAEPWGSNY